MNMQVGTFQQISGTGLQPKIFTPSRPKGFMFFGNSVGGSNAFCGARHWRWGISDGTNNISRASNSGQEFNVVEVSEEAFSREYCLLSVSTLAGPFLTPQIITLGKVNLVENDGFTMEIVLNYGNVGNNDTWHYVVWYGDDVQAIVGNKNCGAAGTLSVTGLPFAPTTLIVSRNGVQQIGPSSGPGGALNFGVVSKCGLNQIAISGNTTGLAGTSRCQGYQREDKFLVNNDEAGSVQFEATLTAFTSDGFTFTHPGTNWDLYYLALGGVSANMVFFDQPLSTGDYTVILEADVPKGAIVGSFGKTASSVPTPDALLSYGAYDGTHKANVWMGDLNGQAPNYKVAQDADSTYVFKCRTPTGDGTSTINTLGNFTSLTAGSATINFSQVDGVARRWFIITFGEIGRGTTPECGLGVIPRFGGIYKLVPGKTNDTYYTNLSIPDFPITVTAKIPDPYFITFPLHDEDENILHVTSAKICINGSGQLELSLLDLDSVTTQTLNPLTMQAVDENEPVTYSNFNSQRTKLKGLTNEINEIFYIDRIILFYKKLWTDYPK